MSRRPAIALAAILGIVVLVAVLFGGGNRNTDAYRVPSESMEPTFETGSVIQVDEGAYDDARPEIGDVIVFYPPRSVDGLSLQCGVQKPALQSCPQPVDKRSDMNFIKRVVAGPGDRFSLQDGHAVVNGQLAQEDFIAECGGHRGDCDLPQEITIPEDHYFVLGDNRPQSADSRHWGPVPLDWIIGRVESDE